MPRKLRVIHDPVANHVVRRATAVVRAPFVDELQERMTAATGRPRTHSWRALLALLLIDALERPGQIHCTRAHHAAVRLTPKQRKKIGLTETVTYRQVHGALASLGQAMKVTLNTQTGEISAPVNMDDLLTRIVRAPIPQDLLGGSAYAIDATDLESYYSPFGLINKKHQKKNQDKKKEKSKDRRPGEYESLVDEGKNSMKQKPGRVLKGDLPIIGTDGRVQNCADPDARDGYRAGKNLREKDTFTGYHPHIATAIPPPGMRASAALAHGLVICPAGSSSDQAGIDLLEALTRADVAVKHINVDRGYSYRVTPAWARRLCRRDISQTIDLHATQRGVHPGPVPGTIFVDGHLFIDALPKPLWELPGFPLNMTTTDRLERIAEYDRRVPFAFSKFGKPNRERGTQRYRGPALTGKVRCPNHPPSMPAHPATRPTTSCPSTGCHCGRTITLGPEDHLRERQDKLYGTTKWAEDYGRRNLIESLNASLKVHHGGLRRGGIRVQTLQRTGILAALIMAATNITILLEAYGRDIGALSPDAHTSSAVTAAQPAPSRRRRPRRGKTPRKKDPPPRTPASTTTWLPATETQHRH